MTYQMAISMQTFFHVSLDGLDYSTEDLTTTHLAHLVMPAFLPPVETCCVQICATTGMSVVTTK